MDNWFTSYELAVDLSKNYKSTLIRVLGVVQSVVEWLERRDCDRHGPGLKTYSNYSDNSRERHFTKLFSDWWWSWQAVLNCSHIFIKL